jgi:hypothetical protein
MQNIEINVSKRKNDGSADTCVLTVEIGGSYGRIV